MIGTILDHPAAPGPLYWDFQCRACDHPVDEHGGPIARWRWRRAQRRTDRTHPPRTRGEHHMDGHEHYARAELLLDGAIDEPEDEPGTALMVAEAQVHATLALVAATNPTVVSE